MTIHSIFDFLEIILVGFAFGIRFAAGGWLVGRFLR